MKNKNIEDQELVRKYIYLETLSISQIKLIGYDNLAQYIRQNLPPQNDLKALNKLNQDLKNNITLVFNEATIAALGGSMGIKALGGIQSVLDIGIEECIEIVKAAGSAEVISETGIDAIKKIGILAISEHLFTKENQRFDEEERIYQEEIAAAKKMLNSKYDENLIKAIGPQNVLDNASLLNELSKQQIEALAKMGELAITNLFKNVGLKNILILGIDNIEGTNQLNARDLIALGITPTNPDVDRAVIVLNEIGLNKIKAIGIEKAVAIGLENIKAMGEVFDKLEPHEVAKLARIGEVKLKDIGAENIPKLGPGFYDLTPDEIAKLNQKTIKNYTAISTSDITKIGLNNVIEIGPINIKSIGEDNILRIGVKNVKAIGVQIILDIDPNRIGTGKDQLSPDQLIGIGVPNPKAVRMLMQLGVSKIIELGADNIKALGGLQALDITDIKRLEALGRGRLDIIGADNIKALGGLKALSEFDLDRLYNLGGDYIRQIGAGNIKDLGGLEGLQDPDLDRLYKLGSANIKLIGGEKILAKGGISQMDDELIKRLVSDSEYRESFQSAMAKVRNNNEEPVYRKPPVKKQKVEGTSPITSSSPLSFVRDLFDPLSNIKRGIPLTVMAEATKLFRIKPRTILKIIRTFLAA